MKKFLTIIILTLSLCFVFTACESAKTTDEKLAEAKSELNIEYGQAIEHSVALPATGKHGAAITWVSSHPHVIGHNGVVAVRPVNDLDATLTATITLDGKTETKQFNVTILERDKSIFNALSEKDENFFEFGNTLGDDGIVTENENSTLNVKIGGMTRFGGYNSAFEDETWNDGYTAGIEVYLDPALWSDDEFFIWSCALNGNDGKYISEALFHARKVDGVLKVGTKGKTNGKSISYGASDAFNIAATGDSTAKVVTEAGWYTITAKFYDEDGDILVQWDLIKNSDNENIFTSSRKMLYTNGGSSEQLTSDLVSGNRYGWFCLLTAKNGIDIRNIWMGTNQ